MHPQGCFINVYIEEEPIEYELHSIKYECLPSGIAICTYNAPKTLNALTLNQRWESFALLEHMARDENVNVVIWTGCGERAFNAGADLKGDKTVKLPKDVRDAMVKRNMGPVKGDYVLKNMVKAFWKFPKPSICAVNGMAIGGAANIALANFHDLVICSEKARFMYPFPRLGFTPELGSSYLMPYMIGFARAKELMYLGDWFSGEDAMRLGLVNKVVPADKLIEEAIAMAEKLIVHHPAALSHAKKIINSHILSKLDEILDAENEEIKQSIGTTGGPLVLSQWMKEKKEWLKQVKSKM